MVQALSVEEAGRNSYTDEQRDIARYVWGFLENRKIMDTVRRLKSDEYAQYGFGDLHPNTLRYWITEHNWQVTVNREIYGQHRVLEFAAKTELQLGAPEATRFLREAVRLVSQNLERPIRDKKGDILMKEDGKTPYLEIDVNLLKAGISAAQLLADRAGHSPVGTRDTGDLPMPPEVEATTIEQVDWDDPESVRRYQDAVYQQSGLGRRAVSSGQQRKAAS